jgi:hypothetical protein
VVDLDQGRVGDFEDCFNVPDIARANPRHASKLLPHINVLSFWQIFQPLVLASEAHVG